MSVEVFPIAVKVVANVGDVFLKERELGIWIPHVCGDAKWILIAIRQARLFRLSTHWLGPTDMVEATAPVVKEH
jgi:hypothetical protein